MISIFQASYLKKIKNIYKTKQALVLQKLYGGDKMTKTFIERLATKPVTVSLASAILVLILVGLGVLIGYLL